MWDGFWGQGGGTGYLDVYLCVGMRIVWGLRFVCLVQFKSGITNFHKEEKTESYTSDSSSSSQASFHCKYEIV
jgi:hypothetical protein